jgi:hypothetical protein
MKSRKIEGRSEKQWDLACTTMSDFICMIGNSVVICFLRKNAFLFQPTA